MKIVNDIPKLKPRKSDAHKGDFGKVCIIGGCIGMSDRRCGTRPSVFAPAWWRNTSFSATGFISHDIEM
jgi:hypothetical protein